MEKAWYLDKEQLDAKLNDSILYYEHDDIAEGALESILKRGCPTNVMVEALARAADKRKNAPLQSLECRACIAAVWLLSKIGTQEQLKCLEDIAMSTTNEHVTAQIVYAYHERTRRTKAFFEFADKIFSKKTEDTFGYSGVWYVLRWECEKEKIGQQKYLEEVVAFARKHLLDENVGVVQADTMLMRYDSSYPKSDLRLKAVELVKKLSDKLPPQTVKRYLEEEKNVIR